MPDRITLDDSSYESIYERAMERLKLQAPWWTHRELSDPGITLLEMWAVLADMQSYYMDQVQESHYRKYRKLLGIREDAGECARTWVFMDGVTQRCTIPQGTKLLADRMVFETREEAELTPNRLTAFYPEADKNRMRVMNISRKSSFRLSGDGERVLFRFELERAPEQNRELRLFILLNEKEGRNPAEPGFCMAQLAWEYQTEEGWQEAEVIWDDTRGLLCSGILCLLPGHAPDGREGGCKMRCRIRAGAFDAMPVLYKIYLNVIEAVQKNTVCCEETAQLSADCRFLTAKSYLARTGRLQVLLQQSSDIWRDITAECEIDPPVTAQRMERYIRLADCADEKNPAASGGMCSRVKLICTAEEYPKIPVTGAASQEIPLPWEGILRDSAELMLGQGSGGLYRMYRREEPEEERYENAWHWKEEENVIVLGDGRHGDIPEPSADGLRFTSLALWGAEKGNISIGRITGWEKPELFPGIACTNLLAGNGGRGRKRPKEQFEEAAGLLLRQNRMVTGEDIRALALKTPGLLLRDAQAEWKDGAVVVTVFPANPLNDYCAALYQKRIREYLEPFRIAGSRLSVAVDGAGEAKRREENRVW